MMSSIAMAAKPDLGGEPVVKVLFSLLAEFEQSDLIRLARGAIHLPQRGREKSCCCFSFGEAVAPQA
jgi:hypothetical protein